MLRKRGSQLERRKRSLHTAYQEPSLLPAIILIRIFSLANYVPIEAVPSHIATR
jgi:hypothetical protein